jgi:putative holliday junction resolvase
MGRYLGIDYGTKRIGLAISDELGSIAFPLDVVENTGERQVIKELGRVVAEKAVSAIVVGMPLKLDGTQGPAAENVGRFVEAVKAGLNLPVNVWDERLSTRIAERAMIEGGLSRRRRKQSLDQSTAQIILQSYLDACSTKI